jgi:hypothetical protein
VKVLRFRRNLSGCGEIRSFRQFFFTAFFCEIFSYLVNFWYHWQNSINFVKNFTKVEIKIVSGKFRKQFAKISSVYVVRVYNTQHENFRNNKKKFQKFFWKFDCRSSVRAWIGSAKNACGSAVTLPGLENSRNSSIWRRWPPNIEPEQSRLHGWRTAEYWTESSRIILNEGGR